MKPSELPHLEGLEELLGTQATVLDFWRWAMGDLRANTTRSTLVEFLIKLAIGDISQNRVEWASFDLITSDGTRVEAKGAAYLQSWGQRKLTQPRFNLGRVTGRTWDIELGQYVGDPNALKADVWIFALHVCQEPDLYDPLDVSQWRFWLIHSSSRAIQDRAAAESKGAKGVSVGLSWVEANASMGPISWAELGEAVQRLGSE